MVQTRTVPHNLAQHRRLEILRAASTVFRRQGFHAAGMREIAAELEVAVGKLYYWFESKHALLAFCQEDCLRRLLSMAKQVIALPIDSALRLHHLIVGHLRCLNEWSPGSLAHLEVESLQEEHRARIVALRDQYEKLIRTLISKGIREGVFRDDTDPKLSAWTLLGATNWSVKWFRPGGRVPIQVLAPKLAAPLVRGLLTDTAAYEIPQDDPFADTLNAAFTDTLDADTVFSPPTEESHHE